MKTLQDKNLKTLKGKAKLQYIWDYYKLPLIVLAILLYIFGYILYNHFTEKERILYTALVNVNAGETLTKGLCNDFLDSLNLNPSQNQLELYTGLYLTDNDQNAYHQYTYASRIKILAMIDGKLLDVVLMNKEAFDAFSQNGYLYDLAEFLPQADINLYESIQSDLVANLIILEDNAIEHQLDTSLSYEAVTEEHYYGIDLSHTPLIKNARFAEPVYLGIIANSPRTDIAVAYIKYLFTIPYNEGTPKGLSYEKP